MFSADQVRIEGQTAQHQGTSDLGTTVTRTFCPSCGSPIYGRNTGAPDFITLTAGTFDDPDTLAPEVIVFTEDRCAWDPIDPSLPAFETQPAWDPAAASK